MSDIYTEQETIYRAAYGVAYGLMREFGDNVTTPQGRVNYKAVLDGLAAGAEKARDVAWIKHEQATKGH